MISHLNKQYIRAKIIIAVIFYSLLYEICCGRDILEYSNKQVFIIYVIFSEIFYVQTPNFSTTSFWIFYTFWQTFRVVGPLFQNLWPPSQRVSKLFLGFSGTFNTKWQKYKKLIIFLKIGHRHMKIVNSVLLSCHLK